MAPMIGITSDLHETRHRVGVAYANAVLKGGGTPIILPPLIGEESKYISICDGFVFSGGDDPNMEQWGVSTHPSATVVNKQRQDFELTLLEKLQTLPSLVLLLSFISCQVGGGFQHLQRSGQIGLRRARSSLSPATPTTLEFGNRMVGRSSILVALAFQVTPEQC